MSYVCQEEIAALRAQLKQLQMELSNEQSRASEYKSLYEVTERSLAETQQTFGDGLRDVKVPIEEARRQIGVYECKLDDLKKSRMETETRVSTLQQQLNCKQQQYDCTSPEKRDAMKSERIISIETQNNTLLNSCKNNKDVENKKRGLSTARYDTEYLDSYRNPMNRLRFSGLKYL